MMRIAALWAGESQQGNRYLSGSLELPEGVSLTLAGGQRLAIFPNNGRQSQKAPTHYLYLTEDRSSQEDSGHESPSSSLQDIPF